ncbi:MAG: Peroxygenase 1 [Ramalina farinacea]|uniref:Peroxygenase 1 n=1 Tax=Ramalina farinacea TaxID=258253 RepID=A0AA43QY91_9LECA|nr:Peroxygenase 1 [Ramalina farinacea]
MDEPTIRFATEADVPTILHLIHALAAYEKATSSVQATEASLRSTLSFPIPNSDDFTPGYAKTILIFPPGSSSSCAGFALFFHNYSTWLAKPGIYLEDLFVLPEYRGRGYGTRLLQYLAREVKRIGGGRLEWSVLKWNEPSIKFYQGDSVGAERMEEWVGMRVEGEERLGKLAGA